MRMCGGMIAGTVIFYCGCQGSDSATPPDDTRPVAAKNAPGNNAATLSIGSEAATPVESLDPLHPQVVIETTLGPITVKLDAERAPITVGNFLSYVQRGFYNGTIFHEVQKNFIVIGGGYTPELKNKRVDLPIRNEAHNGLKNQRYTIAMARLPDSIDSATTHFFFNLADNHLLDHAGEETDKYGYCVFGEVVAGREVVDQLGNTPTSPKSDFPALPAQTVAIKGMKRIR
ncbi:MAG: peptidylprolyl isomerase [Pirellulales bacterium]|nr:peptidylprolyl isomerase [Pirellulales bacterium]